MNLLERIGATIVAVLLVVTAPVWIVLLIVFTKEQAE